MNKQIAVTIKPTMACNMRCLHCFNGDMLNDPSIINFTAVERFLELAARDYDTVKVTFHGGEPTLAGDDFYYEFYSYEHYLTEKYGTHFINLFTTNGVLLSEELIDLLVANDTLVNISFDGPCNYILRQYTETVYNNIRALQDRLAKLRVFCTISSQSLPYLSEIYAWFNERCLDFKILPIEPRGYAKKNEVYLMEAGVLALNLANLYRKWITDLDCQIRVYTFHEFAKLRKNTQFKSYWFNREIALNPDGKIYPFGRPNDINFCLGDPLMVRSILECFENPEYRRLVNILKGLQETLCVGCVSKDVCNGVVLCMSYVYGSDVDMLKHSCNQASKIFQSIINVNDEILLHFDKPNKYNGFFLKSFTYKD